MRLNHNNRLPEFFDSMQGTNVLQTFTTSSKLDNSDTREREEKCSKSIIKTSDRRQ